MRASWKRQSVFYWIPSILFAFVSYFAFANDQSQFDASLGLTVEEKDWLSQHPEITIGAMAEWAPMDFIDNKGQASGIGADFIELINSRLHDRFRIVSGSWQTIYTDASEKRLDAIIGITPKSDREVFFHFTQPYASIPHSIFGRSNGSIFNSLAELENKTVAVEKGFFIVQVLKQQYNNIQVHEYDSTEKAIIAVSKGDAEAYVGNRAVALYLIENNLISNLTEFNTINETRSVNAIGVRKDWPILQEILNKVLDSITVEERRQILSRWGGQKPDQMEFRAWLNNDEIQWLGQHPVIKVAADPAYAPIEYQGEDGQFYGMSMDYLKLISNLLGIHFEFEKNATWSQMVDKIRRKELDIFSAAAITEERKTFALFTEPYLIFPNSIFTLEDASLITDLEKLRGHKVASIKSYAVTEYLKNEHPYLDLIEMDNIDVALDKLERGEVYAHVGNLLTTGHNIRKNLRNQIKLSGATPFEIKLAIGVRDDLPILRDIFQKALLRITEEQHLAIYDKWVAVQTDTVTDHSLLLKISSAMAAVFLLILLWNFQIHKQKKALAESQKQLEQQSNLLQAVLENIQHGLIAYDKDLKLITYNDKFLKVMELPAELFQPGSHFEEWIRYAAEHKEYGEGDSEQQIQERIERALSHSEHDYERTRPNGVVLHIRGAGLTAEGGFVSTFTDITEAREKEQKTKELLYELEFQKQALDTHGSVIISDTKGKITYVNSNFSRDFGFGKEEVVGQTFKILSSGYHSHEFYMQMWHTIREGNCWKGEVCNITRSGDIIWNHATILPFMNEEGKPIRYVEICTNITEQKTAEENNRAAREQAEKANRVIAESVRQLKVMFDTVADGIVTIDENGIIEDLNQAAEKLFQYQKEEIVGKDVRLLLPDTYQEKSDHQMKRLFNRVLGKVRVIEGKRKDGSLFPMGFKLGEGNNVITGRKQYTGLARDITEQKNAEKALFEAKAEADAANQAKSDFLANMSHEIRTPMNAVIGMSHLALKTKLTARQKDYINKILSSSESLLGIINDILDFSKIEAGKLEIESIPFYLDDVLKSVSNVVTQRVHEKGLELLFDVNSDVPAELVGDPLRVGQILINLINNAVKFTEKGEIIVTVSMESLKEKQVHLRFSVKDSGIGMTEEQRAKLFLAFSQADTSITRKYGGTGLGLSICKNLIEMMGGIIWVESEQNQGSEFNFSIQFALEESMQKVVIPVSDELKGVKVLLAETNKTAGDILERMLQRFGLDVHRVNSSREAIDQVLENDKSKHPYQLLLMNASMPSISGVEASRIIKTSPGLIHVPSVIILTVFGESELVEHNDDIAADAFLLKPVNASLLFDTVLELLGIENIKPSNIQKDNQLETQHGLLAGKKALVVEDNKINQEIASEFLQDVGMEVFIANNGREAVELLLESQKRLDVDIILMDLQMPEMDGFEATRKIRNDERYHETPIIGLTAHALADVQKRCMEVGMQKHVAKPIVPNELYLAISEFTVYGNDVKQFGSPHESNTISDVAELPSLDGIDIERGLKSLNNNHKLYFNVLRIFNKNHADTINEIEFARENNDLVAAQRIAHTIKGVAANIGASSLQFQAGELEQLFRESATEDEISSKLILFKQEIDRVLGSLSGLFPNNGDGATHTLKQSYSKPDSRLLSDLKQLSNLLENFDSDSIELYKKIEPDLEQYISVERHKEFRDGIEAYDFERALEVLHTINQSLNM